MGKRARQRGRDQAPTAPTSDYTDAEGNVLSLRDTVSSGTVAQIRRLDASPAASAEDRWQRREELLFERLAVRWTIAGLPLERQAELLGRYRMAGPEERRWVRGVIDRHLGERLPELGGEGDGGARE